MPVGWNSYTDSVQWRRVASIVDGNDCKCSCGDEDLEFPEQQPNSSQSGLASGFVVSWDDYQNRPNYPQIVFKSFDNISETTSSDMSCDSQCVSWCSSLNTTKFSKGYPPWVREASPKPSGGTARMKRGGGPTSYGRGGSNMRTQKRINGHSEFGIKMDNGGKIKQKQMPSGGGIRGKCGAGYSLAADGSCIDG